MDGLFWGRDTNQIPRHSSILILNRCCHQGDPYCVAMFSMSKAILVVVVVVVAAALVRFH